MASNIVILTDLDTFTPVYNPMEVCIQQADAATLALTGYKHIIDVYIEGVSSFKRYEIIPEPLFSYGVVDISRYCEGYVYNVFPAYDAAVPFLTGANANGTQSIIKVTLKYGYSYLLAGVYTVVADSVVGSAKYAWNGSLDYNDWIGFGFNDYICNVANGVNGQFLTDMKTNYVSIGNLGYHGILSDTPTDVDHLVVKTYSSADFTGLIQTVTKLINVTQANTAARNYIVATAPETLNNITGAFVTGAQPIVTASVLSYTVQLTNSVGTVASELLYFVIAEPCRYEQRRLHFLNRFGKHDSFNFNLKSTERREITKTGYKYDKYVVNSTGLLRYHADQAQVTNYVASQDFISLKSDFITEAQNDWLKQLIESPEIYLEWIDESGLQNYKAVESIVGTSWMEKQTENDKLFTMDVEIKMSQKNYRQRR